MSICLSIKCSVVNTEVLWYCSFLLCILRPTLTHLRFLHQRGKYFVKLMHVCRHFLLHFRFGRRSYCLFQRKRINARWRWNDKSIVTFSVASRWGWLARIVWVGVIVRVRFEIIAFKFDASHFVLEASVRFILEVQLFVELLKIGRLVAELVSYPAWYFIAPVAARSLCLSFSIALLDFLVIDNVALKEIDGPALATIQHNPR